MLSGILIGSIVSDDIFVELNGEKIWISPGGGLEKDTNVNIDHFVISHHHDGGGKIWLFAIFGGIGGSVGELGEGLADSIVEFFSINVSGTSNYNIGADVIISMELLNLFNGDILNIFSNTVGGL